MKVVALKGFSGMLEGRPFSVSEGEELELPEGVDWLNAGLVVAVKEEFETAAKATPEKAVKPAARKRTTKRRTTRSKKSS